MSARLSVCLAVVAACSRPDPDKMEKTRKMLAPNAPQPGRHVDSLAKLRKDAAIQLPAKLPTKGIAYAHPGGEIDLDVDAGTVTFVGQVGPGRTVPLAPADVTRLWAEAEDVWRDPKPGSGSASGWGSGVGSGDNVLAIVDHDDAYYLRTGDLPPATSAKKLIDELTKVVPPVTPDPAPQAP